LADITESTPCEYKNHPHLALQLTARLAPLLLLLVSQQPSKDLSRWRLGYLLYEFDTTDEPLILRLVLFNILLDITSDEAVILFEPNRGRLDDKGLWDFSRFLVRDLDHSAVFNRGVGQEMSFELCRCNLKALFDNQHVLPSETREH